MFLAFICSSSVLSSSQNLHLDSTLLSVCKPSNYFPQATSCHFCAQIKFQLLILSNCRFLSICNIPLFSLFLAVSPILLAVGDFIPELFISFRSLVSTKRKILLNTLIHALPHRAELITFTWALAFGYEPSASFQTTSQWPYSGILNYFSFKILSIGNCVCFNKKGNTHFKSMLPIIWVSFSL